MKKFCSLKLKYQLKWSFSQLICIIWALFSAVLYYKVTKHNQEETSYNLIHPWSLSHAPNIHYCTKTPKHLTFPAPDLALDSQGDRRIARRKRSLCSGAWAAGKSLPLQEQTWFEKSDLNSYLLLFGRKADWKYAGDDTDDAGVVQVADGRHFFAWNRIRGWLLPGGIGVQHISQEHLQKLHSPVSKEEYSDSPLMFS